MGARSRLAVLALASAAALAVGCVVGDLGLEGKRCPCTSGWRCDVEKDVCVKESGPDAAPGDARDAASTDSGDAAPADATGDDGGGCGPYGAGTFLQPTQAPLEVSIEAEHHDGRTFVSEHQFEPDTTPGYSGCGAMAALPADGMTCDLPGCDCTTESPRLDFNVTFSTSGVHYVWLRGLGPDGDSDSCHVGLDGAAPASSRHLTYFDTTWSWSNEIAGGGRATITVPSAGTHVVNVWMREAGWRFDKLVLTPDPDYTPSGMGPAESARGSSCTPETDQELCDAHSAECGLLEADDRCGNARQVDCGSCTGPQTCGGGGTANACGPAGATTNLLTNPGVENGLSPWDWWSTGDTLTCAATGSAYCGDGALRCTLGAADFDMHMGQTPFTVQSSTDYRLSFVARSPTSRDLSVQLLEGGGAYASYTDQVRVQLTPEWQPHTLTLTTYDLGGTKTDGYLLFYFSADSSLGVVGGGAGDVYDFDELYLAPE